MLIEPPSMVLQIERASQQIAECDCPGFDPGELLVDFWGVMERVELSAELDEFAGVETSDPHFEELPTLVGTEITVRFDHVGGYMMAGRLRSGWAADFGLS